MNPDLTNIVERISALEKKSVQLDMQPTEKENLKNNLFEGFGTPVSTDTKTYFKVIWKNQPYFIPTGLIAPTSVYCGQVDASGTALSLPSGWTSNSGGTGLLNVVHNLGHSNYTVTAVSVLGGSNTFCQLYGRDGTSFTILCIDHNGNASNSYISFILSLY